MFFNTFNGKSVCVFSVCVWVWAKMCLCVRLCVLPVYTIFCAQHLRVNLADVCGCGQNCVYVCACVHACVLCQFALYFVRNICV
jgi:hypothetical protein